MIKSGSDYTVEFDAYITDMGQSFSSTWNTEDVFGRNDPIATFQGTRRTISLSFDVPAASKGDAEANLKKCAKLATFLYPGYNSKQTTIVGPEGVTIPVEVSKNLSRPPLVKINFGNLIQSMKGNDGLLGFIDSYSFTPVMEAGMFGKNSLYPRTIAISLSFTALHQTELGHTTSGWMATKLPFT